jgi:multidrug efflux pump subunit AcrA (membrane-fusion protein)
MIFKKRKKIIIILGTMICIAIFGFLIIPHIANAGSSDMTVSASPVRVGDLTNYISVTGTVESTNITYVYAQISEKVKTVHVKAGDEVNIGQLLCELETDEIENAIDELKSAMSHSLQQGDNQMRDANRMYNDALTNLGNSTNTQINSAANALRNAESELAIRQKDYDEKLTDYNNRSSSRLRTAEINISNTKRELDTRIQTYNENIELFAVDAIPRSEIETLQKAVETAQENYDEALNSLNDLKKTLADEVYNARDALDNAITAYNNASLTLATANANVQQDIIKYRDNIETARLSTNTDSQAFQLDRLESQLLQTKVKATASGTITAVYAKEGVAANGLLFVIEDTDSLRISTRIKEFNLSKVKEGLPAKIESDATGEDVYEGILTWVSPTSRKDSSGNAIVITDVDFEAEVSVSAGSNLRIGSSARVNLIYEQREGVMYVPAESVVQDIGETSFVYALMPQNGQISAEINPDGLYTDNMDVSPSSAVKSDATYKVTRIDVAVGMEAEIYTEISGNWLHNGLMIVNNPVLVKEGDIVKIGLNNSEFRAPVGGIDGFR